MRSMYYLGVDLGTSNVKTLLIDNHGKVMTKGSSPVGRHENGLAVEQDIYEIYSAVCEAIKQITSQNDATKIISVGISSQGGAIVPLDENKLPIGRVISWLDARGKKYDRQLTEKLGSEFFASHTGHPGSMIFPGQFLRLKKEEYEFFSQIGAWGFVGDVIVNMLTGRQVHDYTSLSIAGLLNPQMKQADPVLLAELGIRESQLPQLSESLGIAGKVTCQAAAMTGLREGTPISSAVHDQYAAAMSCGVTHGGDVMLATGTAWVLLAVSDKYIPPVVNNAFACPHPVKGLYGQMIPLGTGGSAIQAKTLNLGHKKFDVQIVDSLLADSQGPVYKAVEELAEITKQQIDLMRNVGIEFRRIMLTGPAAESEITPKIIQNVTGLNVECFTEPAASAYGAALIAREIHEH